MASTIQEYLKQARAAGVTPTFTNIGGENPMLRPQTMGAGQERRQAPGAYFIEEPGGSPTMDPSGAVTPAPAPAIPAQGQDVTQSQVGQQDPWIMAQKSTKGLLPVIWKETFGDKPFNSELSQAEMNLFNKNVTSMRNAEVDRFKHQQDQIGKDKDRAAREKAALPATELTIKQRADYISTFMDDYDKIVNDPMNPNRQKLQGITSAQYAQEKLKAIESMLGGQAIPGPGEVGPEATPQRPADVGDMAAAPNYAAGTPGVPQPAATPTAPAHMDLRAEIQALAAKYGRTPEGMRRAKEELQGRYPQLNLR